MCVRTKIWNKGINVGGVCPCAYRYKLLSDRQLLLLSMQGGLVTQNMPKGK